MESVSCCKALKFRLTAVVVLVSLFWGIAVTFGMFYIYNNHFEAKYAENAVLLSKIGIAIAIILFISIAVGLYIMQRLVILPIRLFVKGLYAYSPDKELPNFFAGSKLKPSYEFCVLEQAISDIDMRIKSILLTVKDAEKQTGLMLDSSPLCTQLWNSNVNIIDCNEASVLFFGLKNKQEYIEHFYEFSPEFQPDGQSSEEKGQKYIRKAFDEGRCVFSWMHQMPDGTPVPTEVTLVRIKYKDDYVVAGYTRDLREYKWMMSEIEQQTNLMQTVNQVSSIMLQSHTDMFERDLNLSMDIMAKAASADRMYIWENYIKDGELYCHQIYEWSEGATSQKDFKLAVETRYSDIVPEWEVLFLEGKCIKGIVREMSENEKIALQPQGILSIMVVPIFLKKQFWGFVGFDDCHKERAFSEKEEMILRSASQLIANALIRNKEEVNVRKAEEYTKLMLDATPLCIQLWSRSLNIIDCNAAAVLFYNLKNKQEYIERFNELSPEFQPDGLRSNEKCIMYVRKAFDECRCDFNWMHQMLDGTQVPTEVTLVRVKYKDDYVVAGYIRDLRIIKKLEEKAEAAYYDALTGIYNRRYLDESLGRLIKTLSRSGGTLSLLMIDIDLFKRYNDAYGHGEGDICLKVVSETISKALSRDSDFIARYGGEEFTVVLPNTDESGARIIAEKLLENVRKAKIPHSKSNVARHVTISIGIATGNVSHEQNGRDYIKLADEMLYKSKHNGRNRYSFAEL